MKVRIDALDITVLRGGSAAVGEWATAARLPAAARRTRGPRLLRRSFARSSWPPSSMPTRQPRGVRRSVTGRRSTSRSRPPQPWVPLRILALGKTAAERVDADVYLLTDRTPTLLPVPTGDNGLALDHSAAATTSLLDDLRSDRGMDWVPTSGWLTKVAIDASAPQLAFDLAIDPSGAGRPSRVMAGLDLPGAAGVVRLVRRVGPDDRRADLHHRGHRRDPAPHPPPAADDRGLSPVPTMPATAHRPGRLALLGGITLSLGLAGMAAAWARPSAPVTAEIDDPLLALLAERDQRAGRDADHGRPAQRRPDRPRVDRRRRRGPRTASDGHGAGPRSPADRGHDPGRHDEGDHA